MIGRAVSTTSPEDAILSMLEWSRRSNNPVGELRDAAKVLALNPGVDRAYIERWAKKRGVLDSWKAISAEAWGQTPSHPFACEGV
jgi:hypothetical protein